MTAGMEALLTAPQPRLVSRRAVGLNATGVSLLH